MRRHAWWWSRWAGCFRLPGRCSPALAVFAGLGQADHVTVYIENLIGSRYIERADHLVSYRRAFEQMRAQAVPLKEYIA